MANKNISTDSPSKIITSTPNLSNYVADEFSSYLDDYSDSESSSSDGMEIVITDSPKRKKQINLEDKKVLENIEEEIDKQLDEKAAKSNLTATNVKNILKHVISNEHVLAMVRHTVEEGDSTDEETFVYEPKLTRAKAKELYEKQNVINPWVKPLPKPTSDVNILIEQELPEDSDDDEYVPNENEESEDDRDRSDLDSEPATPQTPSSQMDSSTQTNWTDDGIFKIPDTPTQKTNNIENIALRTRSKLSLSDTPLEKIEESFVPPDITTDMYDSECDDEDWKDFLKKFCKPLEDTEKQEDDDEADPEYNVLADEEVTTVDHEELHEELREDKAVKITKKELSDLVAELFDYSDLFLMDDTNANDSVLNESKASEHNHSKTAKDDKSIEPAPPPPVCMTYEQKQLLDQQLRQHVQLTTQHFLQTYQHSEYEHMAQTFKDFLVTLNEMGKYKKVSAFHIANLKAAMQLIETWERRHENDDPQILEMREFVSKEIQRSREIFMSKTKKVFERCVIKHAPLFMKTISESPVFMYPQLLPIMPFKCDISDPKQYYLASENKLIAMGLEQFQSYVETDPHHITKFGKIRLHDAAFFISKYMMPHKDVDKLYRHIKGMNEKSAPPNPIRHFFLYKKAPALIQYVTTLETQGVVAPCRRPKEQLPKPWKNYIYPLHKRKGELDSSQQRKRRRKVEKNVEKSTSNNLLLPKTYVGDHLLVQDVNTPGIYNLIPIVDNKIPIFKIKSETTCSLQNNNVKVNLTERNNKSDNGELNKNKESGSIEHNQSVNNENRTVAIPKVEIIEPDLNKIKVEPIENESVIKDSSTTLINIASLHLKRFTELQYIAKCFLTKDFLSLPYCNSFKFNSSIFSNLKNKKHNPNIFLKMLPSMPFLLTPVKNQPDTIDNNRTIENDNRSPENENQSPEKDQESSDNTENESSEANEPNSNKEPSEKKDDENELNALMVASSTIQKNKKLPVSNTEKRKTKIQREYNAMLAMLSPDNPNFEEEKANNFAQAYFDKVHERLEAEDPQKYQRFMEILSKFDVSRNTINELYGNLQQVLANHDDLLEEFLAFLTPVQAKAIGKLPEHFIISNMSLFLRKLEVYLSNQPAQLRKIYNSLTELANSCDLKMDQIRNTILPLLKGNTLLIEWFLHMFPCEAPPESMMNVFETIQCEEENYDSENEPYETITLPESEDPYGGPNCICDCHKTEDEVYSNRNRHCIPCGTKFIQGRVYVQTGKGLRLANVTFNDSPNVDHNKRLNVKPIQRQKRKSETSPTKLIITSPTKNDSEQMQTESEDDQKKIKYSPKAKRKNIASKSKTKRLIKNVRTLQKKMKKDHQISEVTAVDDQEMEDEVIKSPVRSIESADTCEESSQDTIEKNNSDSDISIMNSESDNSDFEFDSSNDSSWTRQEDKVILQMFKEYGDGEHIYKNIQQVLSKRTVNEIRQRFRLLLSLLQEMSHI